jgi:ankyrin repeat protein
LQAIDPNALGEYGTAFQCAVYYGQFEIVKYILANPRIKIDREDILKTLESLAIYPSCLTGSRPFTKLLPQTTQSNSNTKKIVALLYQFLLENKSDDKSFNLHDFMQKILEEALKNGQFPLVMELLKKEYSLDIKKITPDTWFIFFTKLDSNVRSNQALMSELFLTLITLEDIDISNVINRNFMHISNNLFTPLYRKDLSKSSNEESKPYRGTLFMDFCKLGNLDYVKTLLKKGADPSIISKDNNSALASAAMGGHVEIVRELLTDSRVRTDAMVKSALLQVLAAENPEHKTDVISLLLNQCAKKDILALLEENSNLASVELLSRNKMLLQTLRGYETDVIKITLGARKNGLYVYPYHALALDILQSNKITDFANITSNEDELNELVNFFAYAIKADYNDFFKKVAVTNPEIVKVVFARICGNKEFKNPLQLALEYESFQMANWLLAPESKFGLDLQYSPVSLQPTSRLCEALIAAMKDGEGGLVTKVMKENEAVTKEVFLTAAQIGDTDFVKKVVNMQPEFARYFFATSENNPDWTEEKRKNFDIVQQAFQEADTEQSHLLDGQSIQKL